MPLSLTLNKTLCGMDREAGWREQTDGSSSRGCLSPGGQSVVHGSAAWAAPGSVSEIQNLSSHPRATEPEPVVHTLYGSLRAH